MLSDKNKEKLNILIADDDDSVHNKMKKHIKEYKHHFENNIKIADTTGQEKKIINEGWIPHIIFQDLHMPEKTKEMAHEGAGMRVIDELKDNNQDFKISCENKDLVIIYMSHHKSLVRTHEHEKNIIIMPKEDNYGDSQLDKIVSKGIKTYLKEVSEELLAWKKENKDILSIIEKLDHVQRTNFNKLVMDLLEIENNTKMSFTHAKDFGISFRVIMDGLNNLIGQELDDFSIDQEIKGDIRTKVQLLFQSSAAPTLFFSKQLGNALVHGGEEIKNRDSKIAYSKDGDPFVERHDLYDKNYFKAGMYMMFTYAKAIHKVLNIDKKS